MHLMPSDTEKLLLAVAGMVARDRLARGVKLNHPESVALLSTWVIEHARDGASVTQLMEEGREVLTADQVMNGVAEMIHDVQVEATFPDGRKLVTLHHPVQGGSGEAPGATRPAQTEREINPRPADERISLTLANTGVRSKSARTSTCPTPIRHSSSIALRRRGSGLMCRAARPSDSNRAFPAR